jgi:hypothetical protein
MKEVTMKIILILLCSLGCLTGLSTLICGLWIKANQVTEPSSLSFHTNIGIATVVLFTGTMAALLVYLAQNPA